LAFVTSLAGLVKVVVVSGLGAEIVSKTVVVVDVVGFAV